MRLKKVTKNDPIERLAVSVHQSTMELLTQYQRHYKNTYGEEIERSHLVEEIIRDYISSDKAFLKAAEKPKADGKQVTPPASQEPGFSA